MRVVITGGAGFIGSNLVRYWISRHPQDEVLIFDALTYAGHLTSLPGLGINPRLSIVRGDIADSPKVRSSLAGADLIIHLAAETHNDRAIDDPLPFVRTNVLGTAVLLEACRVLDIPRFHHVSTDEVFGSLSLEDPVRFKESTPYNPRGPYSASKAGGDHLVRAWSETYGLKSTISNCGNNFGPYQHPEKLIPLVITRLLCGGRVPIYGDGRNVRDWIYVADHCSAIDAIINRGKIGTTYLVSGESELSNLELVRRILSFMSLDFSRVDHVADRLGHDRRYALDSTRLRSELGWKPSYSFDDGLRDTIAWYRSNKVWWEPFVSGIPPSGGIESKPASSSSLTIHEGHRA